MTRLYSLHDICEWYSLNSDTEISMDFLVNIVGKKIVENKEIGLYSLDDFHSLLLKQENGNFVVDGNGKFVIKENRVKMNNGFAKTIKDTQKFKITNLNGNKLKLIKLM